MAYIGREPQIGNFQVCDAISVVNGQAAYTMQVDSTNVSPETANHMIVSLNGVLQKPGSSFTVSGSTITFASNLVTGDVIDFIHILGSVLDLGTPSDATVTNAKTNFVSTSSAAGLQIKGDGTTAGALQLNCEQNSHGIKLQSPPHSANQSYSLKFPSGNVTAGKFLKVDSVSGSGTTGVGTMTFADAGGGKVLQVVQAETTTAQDVASSSFADIGGVTVSITPSATSSKIFLLLSLHYDTQSTDRGFGIQVVRTIGGSATNIHSDYGVKGLYSGSSRIQGKYTHHELDSPSTTSATTYKIQAKTDGGYNIRFNEQGITSITAIEIGA